MGPCASRTEDKSNDPYKKAGKTNEADSGKARGGASSDASGFDAPQEPKSPSGLHDEDPEAALLAKHADAENSLSTAQTAQHAKENYRTAAQQALQNSCSEAQHADDEHTEEVFASAAKGMAKRRLQKQNSKLIAAADDDPEAALLAKHSNAEMGLSTAQAALRAKESEAFEARHEDHEHTEDVLTSAAKSMAKRRLQKQNSKLIASAEDDAEAALLAKHANAEMGLSTAQAALRANESEAFEARHEDDEHTEDVLTSAAKSMAKRRLQKQNSKLIASAEDDAEAALLAKHANAEMGLSTAQAAQHAKENWSFAANHEDDEHAEEVFANADKGMAKRRLQKQNSKLGIEPDT